jgi:hypothetical protein
MAALYGTLNGRAKTKATRCGSKNSPVTAHVRGWELGVETEARIVNGVEVVEVWLTPGSNGNGERISLGVYTRSSYEGLAAVEPVYEVEPLAEGGAL